MSAALYELPHLELGYYMRLLDNIGAMAMSEDSFVVIEKKWIRVRRECLWALRIRLAAA